MADQPSPLDLMLQSQRAAIGFFTDAARAVVDASVAGVTQPDELVRQVTALLTATRDLAASTTEPMEAFVASQRQLAETMAAYALLQRQLAELVEQAATSHAAIVRALEGLTSPVHAVSAMLRTDGPLAATVKDAAKDAAKDPQRTRSAPAKREKRGKG